MISHSDLDARDAHGRTALFYASETGKAGAAQLLLGASCLSTRFDSLIKPSHALQLYTQHTDWGADPFVRDADGRSPLDVARIWDRRDCARVLEVRLDWVWARFVLYVRVLTRFHPHDRTGRRRTTCTGYGACRTRWTPWPSR